MPDAVTPAKAGAQTTRHLQSLGPRLRGDDMCRPGLAPTLLPLDEFM